MSRRSSSVATTCSPFRSGGSPSRRPGTAGSCLSPASQGSERPGSCMESRARQGLPASEPQTAPWSHRTASHRWRSYPTWRGTSIDPRLISGRTCCRSGAHAVATRSRRADSSCATRSTRWSGPSRARRSGASTTSNGPTRAHSRASPRSLEHAVLAHASRLTDNARTLAQAGSVLGRCFTPDVIAGVLDRPVAELDDALDELVENAILFPFEYVDKGYYDFRHMLLRDAIYDRVPKRDLRRYHARAAEFGTQLIGVSEVHTSVHFERAGMRDQAFGAARAAADEAMRVHSHREAIDLYRRAIDNMPAELPDAEKARIYLAASDAAG